MPKSLSTQQPSSLWDIHALGVLLDRLLGFAPSQATPNDQKSITAFRLIANAAKGSDAAEPAIRSMTELANRLRAAVTK